MYKAKCPNCDAVKISNNSQEVADRMVVDHQMYDCGKGD